MDRSPPRSALLPALALVLAAARPAASAGAPVGASVSFELAADPRAELVSVVHLLSGTDRAEREPRFAWGDSAYAVAARARFEPLARHAAVASYRRARAAGLDPSMALQLGMLSLTGELSAPGTSFWMPFEESQPGMRPRLAGLLRDLAGFASEGRFLEFYRSQRPYLGRLEELARAELVGRDVAGALGEYSGLPVAARYRVVLVPFLQLPTSHLDCASDCSVLTFLGQDEDATSADAPFGLARRSTLLWHELAHVALDGLAAGVPEGPGCYGSRRTCAREHAAQGVANRVARWAHEHRGWPEPQLLVNRDLRALSRVEERLQEYEAGRDRYPTLKEFYPRLQEAAGER